MDGNWLKHLAEQNVQFVVLNLRDDDDLSKILRCQPGWSVDFEADGSVIFARAA
jgi:hypothetical protein